MKKMEDKKENLEKERENFLQESLKISNKCNGIIFINFIFIILYIINYNY
jgi:hypothetical protein